MALCAGALLAAPSGASADPTNGCTTPDTGEVIQEWTCYWKPPAVGGYAVEQDIKLGVPKPSTLPTGTHHITHMEVDLVDQNFAPVPISRLMLHHIVFLNLARADKTCGNFAGFGEENVTQGYGAPERFYAAGEERAKISFPAGYGYPIRNNHTWSLVYMFMNHQPTVDNRAWVEYKMTIDTRDQASGGPETATPYWLDVANCRADPIYNVPGMHPKAKRRAMRKARRTGVPLRRSQTRSADFTIEENGWIVGGAGHVHGGAEKLTITKPSCNNLQVAQSTPRWGLASHPFYNVKPVLHEPGPIGMSAFQTPTGIPVTAGQKIRLNSIYDNVRPHTRVMGIFIVYLAEDRPAPFGPGTPQTCGGAPGDITYGPGTNLQGRSGPIPYTIPLTGIDGQGKAVTIKGPPGPFKGMRNGSTILVDDTGFRRPNVRIRRGSTLNYFFGSYDLHNLTLANGPLGIGSPNLNANRTFTQKFTRAGTYRLFCGLHPTRMSQRVIVKNPRKKHRRNRRR